jgi:cytochrome c peroxidase
LALGFAGSALAGGLACGSAEPDDGADSAPAVCTGKCDAIDGGLSGLPSAVSAISWDGYLVFGAPAEDGGTCRVMAVRPHRIHASAFAVDVPPAAFSDGIDCPTPLGGHAIAADGSAPVNPYRSDASGTPDDAGDHETYALLVYDDGTAESGSPRIAVRRATVVIAQPRTEDAEVVSVEWSGEAQELRSASGAPLVGIAPTLTADGRLMVMQGHPSNGDGSGQVRTDTLVYAWLPDADAALGQGWTAPRSLVRLFEERDTLVDGLPLARRWPIAQQPLRVPDGRIYPTSLNYFGAYPWLSPDGTELFHTATLAGPVGDDGQRGRHGSVSVIGRATGYAIRHIDGAINPSREALDGPAMLRRMHVSPGATPGFRSPYFDSAPSIPLDRDGVVYSMFGTIGDASDPLGTYNEVSFDVFADRDYLLYMPMNELLTPQGTGEVVVDPSQTPDISGHYHSGSLQGAARFAVEAFGVDAEGRPLRDENTGANGRAIYFADGGRVAIAPSWELQGSNPFFTMEAFVQPIDGADAARSIVRWPGVAELALQAGGTVQATVWAGGQARTTTSSTAIAVNAWTHVAVTYDARGATLQLWVDGALASEATFDPGLPGAATGELTIGPAGTTGGQTPVLAIDEVAISRVVRSADEIARAAGQLVDDEPELANQSLLANVELPLGLDTDDLVVPASNPVTPEAIALGELLFFDPRLSRNGEISCATCHDPAQAWTDGRATGLGIDDQVLTRNTPTILNRAFTTRQFWEGRAETVEMQALGPIVSPTEMDFTIWEMLELLEGIPEYVELFQAAYGTGPTEDAVANAIASFERSILAGNSPVDRWEDGETSALGAAEVRGRALFHGKARCVACHSGSNYSDEEFHMTGLVPTSDTDLGRFLPTGKTRDLHAFRTPSLRNIADTAPFFHDGSVTTLEEVVELYNEGSAMPEADWEIRPLDLTEAEQADLVAFLEALSDPAVTSFEPPATLPGM